MKSATKTRTQRRMEKKQTLLLLMLVLAVSLASFTLGVIVGRRGVERDLAQKQQAAEKILVAQVPPAAVSPVADNAKDVAKNPVAGQASGEQQEEIKLTFYDQLAKEESVPLGSGINLPPKPPQSEKEAVPPISLPDQPIVKIATPATVSTIEEPVSPVKESLTVLPKVDPKGSYAVQVGSFTSVADAGVFKQRLLDKGFPAFVMEADLGQKGLWYRVRLGPYADADTAKSVQQLAEKMEQIKGFVSRQ